MSSENQPPKNTDEAPASASSQPKHGAKVDATPPSARLPPSDFSPSEFSPSFFSPWEALPPQGISILNTTRLSNLEPPLRVSPTRLYDEGRRLHLHPFAIYIIEGVVATGKALVDLPLFPYTLESEPPLYAAIRQRLRQRLARLPSDADRKARILFLQTLLARWGSELAGSSLEWEHSWQPAMPPPTVRRMVSPLKRSLSAKAKGRRRTFVRKSDPAVRAIAHSAQEDTTSSNLMLLGEAASQAAATGSHSLVARKFAKHQRSEAKKTSKQPSPAGKATTLVKPQRPRLVRQRMAEAAATITAGNLVKLRKKLRQWNKEERRVFLQELMLRRNGKWDLMANVIGTK
jgi:hypothetical protein